MKLWTDALFLFAVAAGLVYEFLYEPVRDLVAWCVRAVVAATAGTWRKIARQHAAGVS
jgi:hypothetical protein